MTITIVIDAEVLKHALTLAAAGIVSTRLTLASKIVVNFVKK